MNGTNNKDKILDFHLKNYFDLSILDLLTLEILLNQKGPIKRHSLYKEVNHFILYREDRILLKSPSLNGNLMNLINKNIKEIKAISTSSFYNNLNQLEKKGLLKYTIKNKKIKTVEKTGITFYLIKTIFYNLLQTIISNVSTIPEGAANFIREKYKLDDFDSLLLILIDEFQEIESEYIFRRTKNLTILTNKPRYKNIFKSNNNLTFTHIEKGIIREPEDFFSGIYVGRFQKNMNFHDISLDNLVKEAIRVLKPRGYIIFSTPLIVEPIDNLIIDVLINFYNELNSNLIFKENELRNILESNGINDIHFFNYSGNLITIGFKPDK